MNCTSESVAPTHPHTLSPLAHILQRLSFLSGFTPNTLTHFHPHTPTPSHSHSPLTLNSSIQTQAAETSSARTIQLHNRIAALQQQLSEGRAAAAAQRLQLASIRSDTLEATAELVSAAPTLAAAAALDERTRAGAGGDAAGGGGMELAAAAAAGAGTAGAGREGEAASQQQQRQLQEEVDELQVGGWCRGFTVAWGFVKSQASRV